MLPIQPQVPCVDVDEAARRHAAGARLIDVREQIEWDAGHVPGSELRPMSTINDWYTDLDPAEEVLVICRTGNRSGSVVDALINRAAFTDAHNVSGGIVAWAQADLPVET
jgi:rhodanese-related sulfurtransferase